ncbi:hypothetical protein Drose_25615 [Dactylosporangium roseum]|uniref:Integral membrane protein n=1 Tax=Dactylosporangium roseum TaxID=47989 RepID=A0ABY5Z263_9ACTN|nr:hypothetical protein [Dactylosporangium roseum]UWZ34589.1 hypothetical protein Drose_25615 [Dactylosporangium roseum]
MRATLIRLAMAIYPAPVRDRYGAELTDLLAHSTRPWRDIADVSRSALTEQAATWTWTRTRPQLRRMAWLAAAPLGFGLTALTLALGALMIATTYAKDGGYDVSPAVLNVPIALSVLAVCGAIVALTLPIPRQHHIVAPVLTVPASLTVGILAIANLPIAGDVLSESRSATLLSALCWCAAMLTLGVAITVLIRRGRTGIAVAVLVVGGLATLELTSVLYAIAARRVAADWVSLFSVWPLSVGGIADPPWISTHALKVLPALLAMCTTFALTLVTASAVHQRKADPLRSQSPPQDPGPRGPAKAVSSGSRRRDRLL